VDAIALMDDWRTQSGSLLHPETSRRLFKPMCRDYVSIARTYGKRVFMHSDGHIIDIIPDLIEVGIDALNAQIFCMGVEELGRRFRGRVTFWGEIDRQHLLVQGTRREIVSIKSAPMIIILAGLSNFRHQNSRKPCTKKPIEESPASGSMITLGRSSMPLPPAAISLHGHCVIMVGHWFLSLE
jgi:hypothetical protein